MFEKVSSEQRPNTEFGRGQPENGEERKKERQVVPVNTDTHNHGDNAQEVNTKDGEDSVATYVEQDELQQQRGRRAVALWDYQAGKYRIIYPVRRHFFHPFFR